MYIFGHFIKDLIIFYNCSIQPESKDIHNFNITILTHKFAHHIFGGVNEHFAFYTC